MKYWLVVKELAWAAGSLVGTAIYALLAQHAWSLVGFSTAFLCFVCLSLAFIAPVFVFGWDWIARLLMLKGDTKRAELVLKDSLARWQKLVGDDGPGSLVKKANMADLFVAQKRDREAAALYEQVWEGWKRSWMGLLSPLAEHLDKYGRLLMRLGREGEGKQVLRATLGWRVVFGLRHCVALALILLAILYISAVVQLGEARALFFNKPGPLAREFVDELASLENAVLGPRAASTIYSDYGYSHEHSSVPGTNVDEVYWGLEKSIPYGKRVSDEHSYSIAPRYARLAEIDFDRGNLDQATVLYKEALSRIYSAKKSSSDSDSNDEARVLIGLGKVSRAKKQHEQSADYFEKACSSTRESLGPGSADRIEALLGLAEAQRQLRDIAAAETTVDKAVALAQQVYASDQRIYNHPKIDRLVAALVKKAEISQTQGKVEQAREIDKLIEDLQNNQRPRVHLDESAQKLIITEVRDITGCLLAVKYNTEDERPARLKLAEKLTTSGLSSLDNLPWYADSNRTASAQTPHMVQLEFDQISIKSPDEYGFIRVVARGRLETKTSNGPIRTERFIFVYRMKPPGEVDQSVQVHQVQELDADAFLKQVE